MSGFDIFMMASGSMIWTLAESSGYGPTIFQFVFMVLAGIATVFVKASLDRLAGAQKDLTTHINSKLDLLIKKVEEVAFAKGEKAERDKVEAVKEAVKHERELNGR